MDSHHHLQIGRRPPLSASKAKSHLPEIMRVSGISSSNTIFFDDCLQRDHIKEVEEILPRVTCVRVPEGLSIEKWEEGLKIFNERSQG